MTLQQAETALRMAALAYVEAERAWHAAQRPEWRVTQDRMYAADGALHAAARDLAHALAAEHRVSP